MDYDPFDLSSMTGPVEQPAVSISDEFINQKGRTIAVINQKGGCGKTTTAINLAACLSKENLKVLLIDLDAQANSTIGLGLKLAPEDKTVYHLLKESIHRELASAPTEIIRQTVMPNLDIIPASRYLASLAVEVLQNKDWEYALRNHLRNLKDNYHYILMDCPPALNALTINALTAADEMLVPLQTHYFSLEGMKELFLTVRSVQEKLNPQLKNGRILATLYDKRARINREMLESIRGYFKGQMLKTVIRMNVKLVESIMHGEPVILFDAKSRGAEDYTALAREFIQKDKEIFPRIENSRDLMKFILQ